MGCEATHREQRMGIQWRKLVFGFIPIRRLTKGLQSSHPRPRLFVLFHLTQAPIPLNPFAGQYKRLLKERGGENAPGFHNPGAHRFWKYKLFSISLKPSIQ